MITSLYNQLKTQIKHLIGPSTLARSNAGQSNRFKVFVSLTLLPLCQEDNQLTL